MRAWRTPSTPRPASDARALPLLEFLLQDLYEHRDKNNVLLWSRFEEVGRLAGALVSHADAALAQIPRPQRRRLWKLIFLSLVTMDDQEQAVPTRNRAPRVALERIEGGAGAKVLEVFVAARLFVTDSEAAMPVVSLAHEALLAHWPYLAGVCQKAREPAALAPPSCRPVQSLAGESGIRPKRSRAALVRRRIAG